MNRRIWSLSLLLLALTLLVAACGPKPTEALPTGAAGDPANVPASDQDDDVDATEAVSEGAGEDSDPTASTGEGGEEPTGPVDIVPPEEAGYCEAAPLPLLPVRPVDETDWVKGASEEDAEITLYEYSDFQCPGCGGMAPVISAFLEDYSNVRLVYRHFPLDFHANAMITSEAAEAAGAQGKFWEMHDLLFERVQEWSSMDEESVRDKVVEYAEELDLDVEQFEQALDEGTYKEKVEAQYQEAIDLGLPGTPTFIFNGVLFPSDIGLSYQGLVAFMDILNNQDELFFDEPPALTVKDGDAYQATLQTSQGDIVVDLFPDAAPTHVNSFLFLAEEDWYAGSEFFFVQDNFVAVTGDPTNSTIGYPGYYCTGEEQGVFDRAGLLGMLSNGQFFVTLGADAAQLTGQFALIGQVTEGLDVLDELTRVSPQMPAADDPDVLTGVTIK